MTTLYSLTYDQDKVSGDEIYNIATSLKNTIGEDSKLIVLPKYFNFDQMSRKDIMRIRKYLDSVLESSMENAI